MILVNFLSLVVFALLEVCEPRRFIPILGKFTQTNLSLSQNNLFQFRDIQTAKKKLFPSWLFLISSFIWKNLLKYQHYLRRDPISQINETFSVKGNVQSRVRPGPGLRAGWLVCRTGWTPGLSPRLSWQSSPSFSSLSFSIKETSRHTIAIARSPRILFFFLI